MIRAEREIAKQRRRLMAIESNGMSEIARSYQVVLKNLNAHLSALVKRIDEAEAAGVEVRPGWLAAQDRYRSLIAQHEASTLDYLQSCITTILDTKKAAVELANGDVPALTRAVLGRAPAAAEAFVANSFSRLPAEQMARLVRNAADGRPLGSLLAEIAPQATRGVKDALLSGVARGASIRNIAADVRKASGLAQSRAMLITRTETIRAYRETALEGYRGSEVVTGWIWIAEVNACPVCTAEHGSEHTLDEDFASHPGCRCTPLPQTRSWSELGFDLPDARPEIVAGADRFASLPEADRLAILGRSRFDAYEGGKITLHDMVRDTHSPRWGDGKRTATLVELGIAAT
jgi:SPP1 gp7 family putative phage head morphogenesis protein